MAFNMDMIFTNGMMFVGMILVIIFVGAFSVGLVLLLNYIKKYSQFEIRVLEKDGFGQQKESYDKGGIFVDRKTKMKRLWLMFGKVGLNPNNIPYIQCGKKKVVTVLRIGLKNYRYIKINVTDHNINYTVGEEDVNWAITDYEKQKKLFQNGLLMQMIPYILVFAISIIILVMFMWLFGKISVVADAAKALEHAAVALRDINSGTTIVPGVG